MAIAIKSIPILEAKSAKKFAKKAKANYACKKASVNFKKQVKSANKILAKANF